VSSHEVGKRAPGCVLIRGESACGGIADIGRPSREVPLVTQSGHRPISPPPLDAQCVLTLINADQRRSQYRPSTPHSEIDRDHAP
jgi:hypothetical protein